MAKQKSIAQINQEMRAEIKDYLHTYAKVYGRKASEELTNAAKTAMAAFYADYDPTWYERTYDLMNNSYRPYYHDNGRKVYGGVNISADNMQVYYKNNPKDKWSSGPERDPWLVLESAWEGGAHGIEGLHVAARMAVTPLDMVKAAMNDSAVLGRIDNAARKAANSKSYQYI